MRVKVSLRSANVSAKGLARIVVIGVIILLGWSGVLRSRKQIQSLGVQYQVLLSIKKGLKKYETSLSSVVLRGGGGYKWYSRGGDRCVKEG